MSAVMEVPDLSVPPPMMGLVPLTSPATAPLVGRAEELDRLARLVGVEGDTSGVILLSGDAGIGKTRLLGALAQRADAAGWRVVVGHCLDFADSALPYLPFTEIFGRLDADAAPLADAVARAHPPVTRLMPARRPAGDDHERVDRTQLFEAVHAALEDVGADAPLLLLVEDVHWADQSTRDLLGFLFARRFVRQVSVVVSYRGEDLHRRHPLRATAAQWARLPGVDRMDLTPLPDSDVRSLVRLLRPAPLRESEINAVVERAEGNAFFAEELVAATTLGRGSLPPDLAGLLLVRLDQLDDAARQVVRIASAAGRGVPHDVLARAVGVGDLQLDQALRSAVERNVLVPAGPDSYAFRHAMLAEAVYDDLLPGERVRIHAAYVAALMEAGTRAQPVKGMAAELARHARAAHDQVTALAASIRAGDEAMSVGGPDEALRHYELALEIAADTITPEAADVVDLTAKASAAASAAGHLHKAVALVQDQLHRSADAPPLDRARLLVALASAALALDVDLDVLAVTAEALRLVPDEPATPLRARVMSVHARALSQWSPSAAHPQRGADDDAVRWANEALVLGRHLRLRDVVADATTTLARIRLHSGDLEESQAALEQVVEEAHAAGDPAELRGLYNLGGLYYEQGLLTEAFELYRRGARRALEIGRPWAPYGIDSRILAAIVAYDIGEWDTAMEVVDLTGQGPPPTAEAGLLAAGMPVAAGRGEGDAEALLARIRPWWEADGMIAILCAGPAIDSFGLAGDLEAAIAIHDDVVAYVGDLWQQPYFQARVRLSALLTAQLAAHATRSTSGERAALAARGAELADVAERAAAPTRQRVRVGPETAAWAARARAEHLRLRWLAGIDPPGADELVTAWRASVDAFDGYPHLYERARSQARLAAALRSLGDVAAARHVGDPARATAHRLGAAPLLAELRAAGSTAAAHQALTGPETLTPREREVLELVAEGRSNREIALRLYISAKTVSVHVSNILAKLDAAGRTEAVAVARRRGLLTDTT